MTVQEKLRLAYLRRDDVAFEEALVDVYAILAWYLQNKVAVDAHLAQREIDAAKIQQEIEAKQPDKAEFRARLKAHLAKGELPPGVKSEACTLSGIAHGHWQPEPTETSEQPQQPVGEVRTPPIASGIREFGSYTGLFATLEQFKEIRKKVKESDQQPPPPIAFREFL